MFDKNYWVHVNTFITLYKSSMDYELFELEIPLTKGSWFGLIPIICNDKRNHKSCQQIRY